MLMEIHSSNAQPVIPRRLSGIADAIKSPATSLVVESSLLKAPPNPAQWQAFGTGNAVFYGLTAKTPGQLATPFVPPELEPALALAKDLSISRLLDSVQTSVPHGDVIVKGSVFLLATKSTFETIFKSDATAWDKLLSGSNSFVKLVDFGAVLGGLTWLTPYSGTASCLVEVCLDVKDVVTTKNPAMAQIKANTMMNGYLLGKYK